MAAFELPEMSSAALETFLADNAPTLGLSAADKVSLRIRRRRRSIARRIQEHQLGHSSGDSVSTLHATGKSSGAISTAALASVIDAFQKDLPIHAAHVWQREVMRVLVLGEDTVSKRDLTLFLSALPAGDARSAALGRVCSPDVRDVRLGLLPLTLVQQAVNASAPQPDHHSKSGSSTPLPLVELYVPHEGLTELNLRMELAQHCDVIVACISLRHDAERAAALVDQLAEELDGCRELFARESAVCSRPQAVLRSRLGDASAQEPDAFPPVIVVGLDAEVRQAGSSSTSRHPSYVSSKQAVELAQRLRGAKYMEIFSGNASHAKSVWVQTLAAHQAAQEASDGNAAKVRAAQRSAVAGLPLYEHLRTEAPKATIDAHRRQVSVLEARDDDAADGHWLETQQRKDQNVAPPTQQFLYTLEGSGNGGQDSNTSGSLPWLVAASRVSSTGAIPITATPLPKGLRLLAVSRCRFPSDEVYIPLPSVAAAPRAYVDVATKTFRLYQSPSDFLTGHVKGRHHQPSSASTVPSVRYTTDGSEPTEHSMLYTGPVSLAGLHGSDDPSCAEDGVDAVDDDQPPFSPWPAHGPRQPPAVIKFTNISTGAFRSDTQTLHPPPVLEAPKVLYSANDQTLRLESMLPSATYRYTLDGSVPSYTNGEEYTRPVMIPSRRADGGPMVLRVVALPRIAFPSREVVVNLTTPFSSTPANAASSKPSSTNTAAGGAAVPHFASPLRRSQRSAPPGESVATGPHEFATPRRDGHQSHVFPTTRTASARAEIGQARRQEASRLETPVMTVAPGSRGASPIVRSRGATPERRSASNHSQQHNTAASQQRRVSPKRHAGTVVDSPAAGVRPRQLTPQRAPAENDAPPRTGAAHAQPPPSHSGHLTGDNTVEFVFPTPIALSHITVATPGGGTGPGAYEVFVVLAETTTWMGVGSGELDDIAAVQTMSVVPSARMMPVVRIRCQFLLHNEAAGTSGSVSRPTRETPQLVVRDIKVHGKPFSGSTTPPSGL